jgi:hypothetical protein
VSVVEEAAEPEYLPTASTEDNLPGDVPPEEASQETEIVEDTPIPKEPESMETGNEDSPASEEPSIEAVAQPIAELEETRDEPSSETIVEYDAIQAPIEDENMSADGMCFQHALWLLKS